MQRSAKVLRLILGDQLNLNHSWFCDKDNQLLNVMLEYGRRPIM